MILRNLFRLPVSLAALLATPALARLPYNPTRILVSQNGSAAYIFSPQASSSQFGLDFLNISDTLTTSKSSFSATGSTLPFLSSSSEDAFIPLLSQEGDIIVFSGDCINGGSRSQLWGLVNGTWSKSSLSSTSETLSAGFLSAGLSFSPTASAEDDAFYVFGGMCPNSTSTAALTASDWTVDATYSNNMLTISPTYSSSSQPGFSYGLSTTASRGAPIAEAGLTITPLVPTFSNTSSRTVSQQQSFVLLGGHTQQAFINMSQVALFSLPEASWSFIGVNQPAADSNNVEPRSGHTAVLTPDGTKIVVFGGWVGNVDTPADPQLIVLELGQGYGGTGDWSWTVPTQIKRPFTTGQGIYGHGAAMLPGDVMMISGGYGISSSGSSKGKRQTASAQTANGQLLLFNTTSSSWISTYTNPSSPNSPDYTGAASSSSGVLKTHSQIAGLGAGLGVGAFAVLVLLAILYFYSRRLKQKRALKEKDLRDLALGSDRYHTTSILDGGFDGRGCGAYPEMRTASWANRQERKIGTGLSPEDEDLSRVPVASRGQAAGLGIVGENSRSGALGRESAERTGLLVEVPSPTRGLRKGMHARGSNGHSTGGRPPSAAGGHFGGIHRIDEAEEESSRPGSLKRKAVVKDAAPVEQPDGSPMLSDPFRDPELVPRAPSPSTQAKRQREREVKGWVDDWSVAAAAMDRGELSRNTSKADSHRRTHSNLSEDKYSQSVHPGRGSPDKSDRTGSNLSEASNISAASLQRSVFGLGSLSRNVSHRSASAGYALFAGAAAAVAAKVTGGNSGSGTAEGSTSEPPGIARAASKRSVSLTMGSNSSSSRYGRNRERPDIFTTALTSLPPLHSAEDEALLNRVSRAGYGGLNAEKEYWATPPESPMKERYPLPGMRARDGSLGHTARGLLGSVRRVFTGTSNVGVQNRVAEFENRSEQNSPTKDEPEMMEIDGGSGATRMTSASTAFLRAQRGAKDWDGNPLPKPIPTPQEPVIIKRKPLPGQAKALDIREDDDVVDDDWDVEAAVERRVVQVMFTVPREKLRVVNADALSLLSKSDYDGGENEPPGEKDVVENKRVSVVPEESEDAVKEDEKGEKVVRDT